MDVEVKKFRGAGVLKTALLLLALLLGLLVFGAGTARAEEGAALYGLYDTDNQVYACNAEGQKIVPAVKVNRYNVTNLFVAEGVTTIVNGAFNSCYVLKTVKLPGTLEVIGEDAFRESTLESIEIPEGVTTIGKGAFWRCRNLKTVELSEGVTTIGNGAFYVCYALKTIELPGTLEAIGEDAFNSSGLESIEVPEGVTTIGDNAFFCCDALKTVKLPSTLTQITRETFARTGLESIEIPEGVKMIGSYAFDGCGALKTVKLPEGMTTIGLGAFGSCTALKTVKLPSTLTEIAEGAFSYSGLESIEVPEDMTKIGNYAFKGCYALKTAKLPSALTEIAEETFRDSALESIEVPEGVETIGNYAFSGCRALKTVKLPSTLTDIGQEAFCYCNRCTHFVFSGAAPPNCGPDVFWDVPSPRYMELVGDAATSGNYPEGWEGFTKSKALGKDVNVSIGPQTYEGKPIEPALGIAGQREKDYNVTYQNNTVSGTATVAIISEGCSGMYAGTTNATFTITPAPLSLESGSVETKTYDGQSSAVVESVAFAGLKNGEALIKDIDYSATAEFTNPAAGPDKEAVITVALEKNDKTANYTLDGPSTLRVKSAITPAAGSGQVSQEGWTYGQTGASPMPVSETNGTDQVAYAYKIKDAEDSAYATEKPTNAGDYTLRATFAETQNYKAVTATADFTIAPAEPTLTITPDWVKELQVGEPITLSIALKGVNGEQPKGTVNILGQTLPLQAGQASVVYTPADDAPKTLTAEYTPEAGENYKSAQNSITLKADKKTRQPITQEDTAKTYGDPAFTLAPTGGSLQAGESYQYASDNETVAMVDQNGEVTLRQAGIARITVSVVESNAWNSTAVTMTLTVNKATPAYDLPENLTAVYGQTLKEVTLPQGFAWQNAKDTAVGSVGSNPFKVIYTPDDQVNYNSIRDIEVRVTVTPAAGSAKVSQEGWTYGQTGDRPVPVSETNGTENVTYAYKTKDADDSTYAAEKPTNAGDYTVQATFAATQNYKVVTATADFTIEKAQPVMTIAPEAGKEIQVGEPVTLNIALKGVKDETPEGTVAILGKNLTLKDGQASIAYTPADTKPITLTATYTPAEGENYTGTQASLTLTAGKKTRAPITLSDLTKTYGDPAFTLTPTGGSLQASEAYTCQSDDEAVAVVKADGTVTIKGAGTAHITVSVAESSAWNPAAATMTLTVDKAKITGVSFEDTAFTEDSAEHKIELTGSLPEGTSVSYENNVQKAPGTYTAKAIIDGGVNYESLELTAVLTITEKPADPTPVPPTPTPGTGSDTTSNPAPENTTNNTTENTTERTTDNTNTGLAGSGTAAGAAVLLSLLALTGLVLWQKSKKQ